MTSLFYLLIRNIWPIKGLEVEMINSCRWALSMCFIPHAAGKHQQKILDTCLTILQQKDKNYGTKKSQKMAYLKFLHLFLQLVNW